MPNSNPQSLVDRVVAKRGRLMRWLLLANLLVGLLLASLVWSVLQSTKRGYETRALNLAEGLAAVAQLNIGSELAQVDSVMQATLDDMQRTGLRSANDGPAIDALLRSRYRLLKGVESLRMSDESGRVAWGWPSTTFTSVADREYFQQALNHRGDRPILAGPFRSRASGHWVIAVVRPVLVSGRFAGAMYATLTVAHFAQVFDRYDLGLGDAMALRTPDLRLVARRSPGGGSQGDAGTVSVSQQLADAVAAKPSGGAFVSRVAVDGMYRTTAYRAVEGWPLTVFAGVSNDRFFAPWYHQAWQVGLMAALAWALVGLATAAVYRFGAREAGAMQAITAHALAQRQAQQRIGSLLAEQTAMLNNDLVGMIKLEQRMITWRNRAFETLLGYGDGELEGQPMRLLYADEETFHRVGREAYPLLLSGANYRAQVRMRRKSGDELWVDLNGMRLSEHETFWMAVDATATREAHDHLSHAARHDALTQLPNRVLLLERLQQGLAARRRPGDEVAVCYMDLDGFKAVNDAHGHDAGDLLLVEVARRMAAQVRTTDTVARIGGDEFVLVLQPLAGDGWRKVLERVVAAVNAPIVLPDGREVQVGASAGVATSSAAITDPAELLSAADRAMLAAKRGGKGRLAVAPDECAGPHSPTRGATLDSSALASSDS
ncbi:MAG: diguanylate cyclase domain-containing protein [Aquincola tertiaricarbonis]